MGFFMQVKSGVVICSASCLINGSADPLVAVQAMTFEARLKELGLKPLYGNYRPMSADEIAQLEQAMGGSLPDDYKSFISKFGCSHFGRCKMVVRPITPPPRREFDHETGRRISRADTDDFFNFSVFLGGGDKEEYRLLLEFELFRDRIPESVFPFADDLGGSVYCLGVTGKDREKVYYWSFSDDRVPEDYTEQGLPVPENILYLNMTLVANSFTDFVNRLESRVAS
jgi:hypothetical protein